TMNETQALLLLVPPGWVRIDAGGAIRWSIDESEDDLPVTDVCYWDAQLFLVWARKATGINRLRLPTWGEWTRAASGGHATREPDDFNPKRLEGYPWPWGHKVDPQGCNNRNHIENRKHGKRLRNVQESYSWHGGLSVEGLMSMAGNAAEWTDNIARNYRADEEGALYVAWNKDEEARTERAFVCGGSYMDGLDDCRVDSRVALFKTERRTWVGFRLVTQSGF
ncbi:MAG: SUMF1/EgtB/PvdO family nonheme iron enzyme, partial [Planctomycetota bacterium]|nr:SUMF1/EgtB/PvdO family nonheme iron enzyme [Planctomycetota bacterium]